MKMIFKVEKSDLVGDIKNFPIEVVEKMVEEQVRQGCQPDVEAFQQYPSAGVSDGGFNWGDSIDGNDFWEEVIGEDNFELFFKKYPKKANLVFILGDSEIGMDIIKTLEKQGGVNRHNYKGDSDGILYYIEPNNNTIEMCCLGGEDKMLYDVIVATYTRIDAEESIFEVSMKEIAEKFGVDVNSLRIKK